MACAALANARFLGTVLELLGPSLAAVRYYHGVSMLILQAIGCVSFLRASGLPALSAGVRGVALAPREFVAHRTAQVALAVFLRAGNEGCGGAVHSILAISTLEGWHRDNFIECEVSACSRFVKDQLHSGSMKVTLSPIVESRMFFALEK